MVAKMAREIRGQGSEIRCRRSEVRGWRRKHGARSWELGAKELRATATCRRTQDRAQRSERRAHVAIKDLAAAADPAFGQANVRRVSFHLHRIANTGDFDHGSAYAGPISPPGRHSRASSELRDFPALRGRRSSAICPVER